MALTRTAPGSYRSTCAADTIELGRRLGACLQEGDVLVLTGDLGAGKTQLTKGAAEALGYDGPVTSPTFNIQNVYDGDELPLYHFDLYRLEDPDQLGDAGLLDALGEEDGACLIEWGEAFGQVIGDERVDVLLRRLDDEVAAGEEPPREIRFEPHGARAEALVAALDARSA
jgi:tRNA threonylcarbamoyladenosine biosynthesis protein TsaE